MLIGIFGGSFNPIHNGHIAIAHQLRKTSGFDEIWFVVSPHNPLKQRDELMDDELRLELTRNALHGEEGLVCSDYEFHLPRPSYMWHTLQSLSKDYPEHTFALIIGADNWHNFSRWYHADDILANYRVVVYPRKDYHIDMLTLPEGVEFQNMNLYDVSSTLVRNKLLQGDDISPYVPRVVQDLLSAYAERNKLIRKK